MIKPGDWLRQETENLTTVLYALIPCPIHTDAFICARYPDGQLVRVWQGTDDHFYVNLERLRTRERNVRFKHGMSNGEVIRMLENIHW